MEKDFRPIWLYLLISIGGGVLLGIILSMFKMNIDNITNLATIISGIIMFVVFFIIYKSRIINDIKRLTKKDLLFTLIMSILLVGGNYLLGLVIVEDNSNQEGVVNLLVEYKILGTLCAGVLIPMVEEFLFRYSLDTIFKNKYVFLIVSSLLFGVSHIIGVSTIIYVYIGILLGIIYLKTNKNVIATTISHVINNIISILMVFFL